MRSNQKGFGLVEALLVVVIASLVGSTGWYVAHGKSDSSPPKTTQATPTTPSPPTGTPNANTVSITLTDASTGRPIAAAKITLTSDNGLRCESAPCANNKKSWEGTTDASGVLLVPKEDVQAVTRLDVAGYTGATLTYGADKTAYQLALKPSP